LSYKPSGAYAKEFVTTSPTTGAATNADSLPTATANKNGTDDGSFTLTVANIDTGRYKVTGTIPSGYVSGDVLNVTVAATVGTVAGKAVIDTQVIDSKRVGDLQDPAVATIQSGLATTAQLTSAVAPLATSADVTSAVAPLATSTALAALVTTVGAAGAGLTSVPYTGPSTATIQSGLATTSQLITATAPLATSTALTALTTAVGTPAQASTALTNATWTDTKAGYIDAAISSVSGGGGGTAPTVEEIRTEMDANSTQLAKLDATISSRSTYAGGAVASVTAPVTVGTVTDKAGYTLGATGLDLIGIGDPGIPANHTTFPKLVVATYRRFFRRVHKTPVAITTYADDNTTVRSTQVVSDDGTGTQDVGAAS